jgi:DNA-directed RNA polymerase specialized sigma24 family protein
MLFEVPSIKEQLAGIVQRVSWDPSWNDDLMQEALIHLWRLEEEEPGHALSWYLQSCQFRLQHYIATGRSVDSWKRSQQRISFFPPGEEEQEEGEPPLPHYCDSTAASDTSAEEMLCLLRDCLPKSHLTVLAYLSDGLSSREIGQELGVSHKTVLKQRRQIATVARGLGITPEVR